MGFRPLPSTANFVLMAVGAAKAPDTALALAASLQERGIAVRAFPGLPGLGDCIRITIGPWESMQRLLDALGEVLLARQEEVLITPGEP
jgi:histidinol-phosphate/aromatic aminotransferase/cobyric acid decarboxylase-like protein